MKINLLTVLFSAAMLIGFPSLGPAEDLGSAGADIPVYTTLSDLVLSEVTSPSEGKGNPLVISQAENTERGAEKLLDADEIDEEVEGIADPLEPFNRAMFRLNDDLYTYIFKPISVGYRAVVPTTLRVGVKNFFYNLGFPIRFVNCLLQGKVNGAGLELTSFTVNSTVGMAGFVDVASKNLKIEKQVEDFDQTLGVYGFGPGFYITWPIIGPSSVRNTLGIFSDGLLDPVNYIVDETKYNIAVKVYKTINNTSLVIGDYEDLKEAALDPYISIRNAYWQNRQSKVKK